MILSSFSTGAFQRLTWYTRSESVNSFGKRIINWHQKYAKSSEKRTGNHSHALVGGWTTHFKNISQIGSFPPQGGENKNIPRVPCFSIPRVISISFSNSSASLSSSRRWSSSCRCAWILRMAFLTGVGLALSTFPWCRMILACWYCLYFPPRWFGKSVLRQTRAKILVLRRKPASEPEAEIWNK